MILTYFIATPPDRGWQRNEGLLLLHTGLEQNALELQYIAICNSNPVLEWPQRLHRGLECSVIIAINHDCIVPESENRIQLIPVRWVFA